MSVTDIAIKLIKNERQKAKDARDKALRLMKAKQHAQVAGYIRRAQYHEAQIEGMQRLARELNSIRSAT